MNHTPIHRPATSTLKGSAIRLSISVLAAALTAIATLASAGGAVDTQTSAGSTAKVRWVGVFTGRQINGVPVYRLPAVTVMADRKLELTKMEREERMLRAHQSRSKAAARRPV